MLSRLRRGRRGRGRRRGPAPRSTTTPARTSSGQPGAPAPASLPPPGRPAGRRRLRRSGISGPCLGAPSGQAPGDRAGGATGRALLHLLRGDGVVRPGAPGRLSRPLRARARMWHKIPSAHRTQSRRYLYPHGPQPLALPPLQRSRAEALPGPCSTSYARRRAGRCAPATGSSARSPQRSSTACATSSQDGWDPHRQASVHLDGTGETLIKGLKRPVLVTGGPLVSGFDSDLATATMGGCRNATFDNCYQFDSRAIRNRSCGRAASENRLCGTLKTAFHELHRLYV